MLEIPALDYYTEEAVAKLIEGDWKWPSCGMRYSRLTVSLIAMLALSSTGSSVSRRASSEHSPQLSVKNEALSEERDSVAVVRDTITITKTVTVDRNDKGDTLRIATETDRY